MAYLRRISERHQITIPPAILRDAGVANGAWLSIDAEAGKIVLEPREVTERDLSEEDWDKLDRLVKKQVKDRRLTEYAGPREAKKHLGRFRK